MMKTSWAVILLLADLALLLVTLPRFPGMLLWEKAATFAGLVTIMAIGSEELYRALRKSRRS
jgi:hypothetical protein